MSKPPTLTQRVVTLENLAKDNRACIGELADGLLGTPKGRLDGSRQENGVTHRLARVEHNLEDGLTRIVRIEDMLGNGGVRVKWRRAQWGALATTFIVVTADIAMRLT